MVWDLEQTLCGLLELVLWGTVLCKVSLTALATVLLREPISSGDKGDS